MGSWLSNYFSPKTTFADLFNQVSNNLTEMSALLIRCLEMEAAYDRAACFKQIDVLESKGDDCTHKIYLALGKITFAPFNKKDIHVLASAMDDIADQIQEATGRMNLYDVTVIKPSMKEMADYILKAVAEIEKLITSLYIKNDLDEMYAYCRQIKDYEHQTDLIYYSALAELFENEKDPIVLLKYKDILYSLESAANRCKNTADAIETILLSSL